VTTSKQTLAQDEDSKHIICFVALPFKDSQTFAYETVLLPAIRAALELDPYYWQVDRADDKYFEDIIQHNIGVWMKHAQTYIADISDLNPNVMMELGYMIWARKPQQPLIVLERVGTGHHLSDLGGLIRISYPDAHGKYAIAEIAESLKAEIAKKEDIQKLNRTIHEHYLSPLLLRSKFNIDSRVAETVSQAYITMEAFSTARVNEICYRIPDLSSPIASGLKKAVINLIKALK
jgi:hypothetical protein